MQRSTIIASVVAGAGILIAGSVAGTAAINAAASSEPDPSTIQLVADVAEQPIVTAAQQATPAVTLEPFTTEPLPEIASPSPAQPSATPETAESDPSTSSATAALPPEQAVALVLAATGGGLTQDIRQSSRAGYDAWAVTVQRPDGSVVTGFVDRASATVFDWRVVQQAPQPAPMNAGYEEEGYEEEGYEEEEYEEEEYDEHGDEHEEDEHTDEHEGDEDDD